MIEYLLKSMSCFGVLYVAIYFLFKDANSYQLNRLLFLFCVIFSIVSPALNLSISTATNSATNADLLYQVMTVPELPSQLISNEVAAQEYDLMLLISLAYKAITFILLGRFLIHLSMLFVKGYQGKKVSHQGHTITLLDGDVAPFTFFQFMFVGKKRFENQQVEEILVLHEAAHKRQLHSIDVVLMELVQVFFWFNPFVYLFKRLIKTNHEYLADAAVVNAGIRPKAYINSLLLHTFPKQFSTLSSDFSHSLIKQRIMMLSKLKQKRPTVFSLVVFAPFIMGLFFMTAFEAEATDLSDSPITTVGTCEADSLIWSAEDKKVRFKGKKVKVRFGDNNVTGGGTFSFLGNVHYLVIDNMEVEPDQLFTFTNSTCRIVQLSPEDASKKYGDKGKLGAVEITVIP